MEDEKTKTKKTYISVLALTMMNVSMVAGLANDVQQSFYGLASVTYFAIGLFASSSQPLWLRLNLLLVGVTAEESSAGLVKV